MLLLSCVLPVALLLLAAVGVGGKGCDIMMRLPRGGGPL